MFPNREEVLQNICELLLETLKDVMKGKKDNARIIISHAEKILRGKK